MPKLKFNVKASFDGNAIVPYAAVVDIFRLDESGAIESTPLRDQIIQAGSSDDPGNTEFMLDRGDYLIQVRPPSGQIVNHQVKISDEDKTLPLTQESPPDSWLAWLTNFGDAPDVQMSGSPRRKQSNTSASQKNLLDETGDEETPPDELTRIKGVGQVLARRLRQRGIERFEQVARLSEREQNWLNKYVPGVRGRLEQFDWVRQADDLLKSGASVPPVESTSEEAPPAEMQEDQESPALSEPQLYGPEPKFSFWKRAENGPNDDYGTYSLLRHILETNSLEFVNEPTIAAALGPASSFAVTRTDVIPVAVSESDQQFSTYRVSCDALDVPGRIDRDAPLNRIYVFLGNGETNWLTVMPLPWVDINRWQTADLNITVNKSVGSQGGVSIVPRDSASAPLLGYLQTGDFRASKTIIDNAKEGLFEKLTNPYLAAAGAHVLINDLRWNRPRSTGDTEWFDWIGNLHNWNPWLPDGAILKAWLLMLSRSDKPEGEAAEMLEKARTLLIGAAHSGLPALTASFKLLVEGLKLFGDDSESRGSNDCAAHRVLDIIDLAALRLDPRQTFTTIRLSRRR